MAERRRARSSSNLGFPELLGGQTASFRSVAQRRSFTTRVEARVVARPLRWVQAHIGSFGGDKDKVVFDALAGAMIGALMLVIVMLARMAGASKALTPL